MAFESKSWGWNPELVETSKIFHKGGEVFVALNTPQKTQSYFKDLKSKRIRGIRGYHYGFLGLSTGAKAIKGFNIEFTSTHDGNIRAVLSKRADIAVVPKEYLDLYFHENPEAQKLLLISKEFDQIYELGILVSTEQKSIQVADINKMLEDVLKDGSWNNVLRKKGISSKHP